MTLNEASNPTSEMAFYPSVLQEQIDIAIGRNNAHKANLFRQNVEWEPGELEQIESQLDSSTTFIDRFAVFLQHLDKVGSLDLGVTAGMNQDEFIRLRNEYRHLRGWLQQNEIAGDELERKEGARLHFDPTEDPEFVAGTRNRVLLEFVITDENGVHTTVVIRKRMSFLMSTDDCERIVQEPSKLGFKPEVEDLLDGRRDDAKAYPVSTEYYIVAKPIEE